MIDKVFVEQHCECRFYAAGTGQIVLFNKVAGLRTFHSVSLGNGLPLNSIDSYAHHREVIVGICTVTVLLNGGAEDIDHLLGRVKVAGTQDFQQTVVAELILLAVFCLVEAVGVYKQWTTLDRLDGLALVFHAWP